ncbi:DNA damage-binding protein CMR1 [Euphorbia peplus]|nr:DNA damage-binding protein CMR1 [Euphorbia peplus]
MEGDELTEYERKRLQNIRRNVEMLGALKVTSKASQLSASCKRHRLQSVKKKLKPDTPLVIRQSLRRRGMPPHLLDIPTPPSVHKPKPVTGPVSLTDAYSGTGSDRALIHTILSLQTKPRGESAVPIKEEIDRCGSAKVEPSDDTLVKLECGTEIENKEVESCLDLSSMKLEPQNMVKLMPDRIVVVKFVPSNDVNMIATGDTLGNIAFWKPEEEEGDGIYLYHPHTALISGILFRQSCLSKIFTSCHAGFLRMMNAEKEVFDLIYSGGNGIFSMSQLPNDMNGLYFGEGDGGLSILDERMGRLSSQLMLHESRINTIDFNSQNPNMMATSSTDGRVCVWDLRSVNADKPNCLQTVKFKRAMRSAYFSPSGRFLATTCLDNTVGIFNSADLKDESFIRPHEGLWFSVYSRCVWGWDDAYMYIGNSYKKRIDVISRLQRRTVSTLEVPHKSAVPCRFDIHPYHTGMLAGGTGGGHVYMWTST